MVDSVISCTTDKRALKRLFQQLQIVTLPPKERAKFVNGVGKKVIQQSRKNISQQRTVSGSPMKARKNGSKKKLLRKMGKGLVSKRDGNFSLVITWKGGGKAKIAYKHQHGITEIGTVRGLKKQKERGRGHDAWFEPDDPATKGQAKRLKSLGYKVPVRKKKNGRWKLRSPSLKSITENMTFGHAGLLIYILKNQEPAPKPHQWKIEIPAREFLGVSPEQASKYITDLAEQTLSRIKKA